MSFDAGIFLAALGITTLELVEAAAVGLALYSDSRRPLAFLYVALGVIVVFAPMFIVGAAIALLPVVYVRLVGGFLLLYFGLRLVRSARRSVLRARMGGNHGGHSEKGVLTTGFSVGAVEAFEAAIVLVALLPNGFRSTVLGMACAALVVVLATYVLRNQVRRMKQAHTKVVVSALLLSFAFLWLAETVTKVNDLVLIPLFAVFSLTIYTITHRKDVVRPDEGDSARQGLTVS